MVSINRTTANTISDQNSMLQAFPGSREFGGRGGGGRLDVEIIARALFFRTLAFLLPKSLEQVIIRIGNNRVLRNLRNFKTSQGPINHQLYEEILQSFISV